MPGTRLARVAELPTPPGVPVGPGTSGFDRACAMRLRDTVTGQEYLLMRSEITHDSRRSQGVTTGVLRSALGEYAPTSASGTTGERARTEPASAARVRADCTTSQVMAAAP
ncbi:hypothetical protein J421_5272 (plasmid) [Gemmatirosa kalamazoonensis]|uniref:Uncharacterized protein n=1 Tax=Gemmatirosa kalamazoonensis TaxID=861299 RepID=W0RQS3_9BACT|nr:hypothetical protein [Gemmatirosa kalamazoonensis]AHG92807.1 hypothetical protein J421_5272 [Gemmatirosa kalamazoonensis]